MIFKATKESPAGRRKRSFPVIAAGGLLVFWQLAGSACAAYVGNMVEKFDSRPGFSLEIRQFADKTGRQVVEATVKNDGDYEDCRGGAGFYTGDGRNCTVYELYRSVKGPFEGYQLVCELDCQKDQAGSGGTVCDRLEENTEENTEYAKSHCRQSRSGIIRDNNISSGKTYFYRAIRVDVEVSDDEGEDLDNPEFAGHSAVARWKVRE